jgi:hypothetical protein
MIITVTIGKVQKVNLIETDKIHVKHMWMFSA